jgi:hypothetical protein
MKEPDIESDSFFWLRDMKNSSMKPEFLMVCEWLGEPFFGISFSLYIEGEFAHEELLDHRYTLSEYRSAYDYLDGLLGVSRKVDLSSGEEFVRLVSYLPKDYTFMKHVLVLCFTRRKKIQKALGRIKVPGPASK